MSSDLQELLLIVEDSNEDFRMLQRLMRRLEVQTPIHRCHSGDEALEYLYQLDNEKAPTNAPRPSVILLDLNLPGVDGREVLAQLKRDQALKEIPIVIFTTSDNPQDIQLCYQNGANGYLVKPMQAAELKRIVQAFVEYWLDVNRAPQS